MKNGHFSVISNDSTIIYQKKIRKPLDILIMMKDVKYVMARSGCPQSPFDVESL